ncbi:enoyl-CoA hydratase/isomerase family protein [soil metagenome]
MESPDSSPSGPLDGRIDIERLGAVSVVTLDRPARRNALSPPFRDLLSNALESVMADPACRVVVLTGAGGHFCSGGDVGSFEGVTPVSGRIRMQRAHRMVRLVVRGEKPVIAAVEGHAAGAGMCLAADCDIVVASRAAQFSCTFNRIGLLPDVGGLWSVPVRMGVGRAKLLMLTGRTLDGVEAERQGLVDELCEPGTARERAIRIANEIALTAPLVNGLVKSILARGPMPLEELLSAETDAQGVLYGSEDFNEGRLAFLEKRSPAFKGR